MRTVDCGIRNAFQSRHSKELIGRKIWRVVSISLESATCDWWMNGSGVLNMRLDTLAARIGICAVHDTMVGKMGDSSLSHTYDRFSDIHRSRDHR